MYANDLYEILRHVRYQIAKTEGVAPYMVFGDGTLRSMASIYPTSKRRNVRDIWSWRSKIRKICKAI